MDIYYIVESPNKFNENGTDNKLHTSVPIWCVVHHIVCNTKSHSVYRFFMPLRLTNISFVL